MRTSTAVIFAAASVFLQVSANLYVTQPVASTICAAGQQCIVAWNDDGTTPALGTIGPCEIDLCTGNSIQQTCLMNISPSIDVSQNAQVTYTVPATLGPNLNKYFIKFTSISYKNPTTPQYPFEAFSAMFTLSGMTGTFNSSILSEIAGPSSVASVPLTTPAVMTTAVATPAAGMTTAKASVISSGTAKSTGTAKASGAANVVVSFTGMAIAVAMGVAVLRL